jgi:hypothetical protein
VTVIWPLETEEALRGALKGVRSSKDAERAAAAFVEKRIASKDDMPVVEDFPLAPEEETRELTHLVTTLQFRFIRAMEHWRGNTHLTLAAIIVRTIKQGISGG